MHVCYRVQQNQVGKDNNIVSYLYLKNIASYLYLFVWISLIYDYGPLDISV